MSVHDIVYANALRHVYEHGEDRSDRTGVGTRSIFGYQMHFDLRSGFPLLTTKKVHFHSVMHELLWLISGNTNIKYLQDNGVSIWDEWADENGNLGPVYGDQWRFWLDPRQESIVEVPCCKPYVSYGTIDQLAEAIKMIRTNPDSRRIIVSAWNPSDVPHMKLPPCHTFFQFYVSQSKKLQCHLYMRSADLFLGVPFNIASYALLLQMVAHITGLEPSCLTISYGDLHIYQNHMEQVALQLSRDHTRAAPQVCLDDSVTEIDEFSSQHIFLQGYEPFPAIKAPVAV